MGWLKLILEDILNEVDTNVARQKHYKAIPDDIFNAIAGGKPNLDKVDQFFLNFVRDNGESYWQQALDVIERINELDPKIQKIVRDRIGANKFVCPTEIQYFIERIRKTGLLNNNQMIEMGYHVLGQNDEWRATCTTTYAANSHYYGHTHWCTASDRNGTWDGYYMFTRYTIEHGAVLIQFINLKNQDECYQVECYTSRENAYGDSKDFEDEDIYPYRISEIVGSDLFHQAVSMGNRIKYYDMTVNDHNKEDIFENCTEKITGERRAFIGRKQNEKNKKLEDEAEAFNDNQTEFAKQLLEKAKQDGVFKNTEFISGLIDGCNADYHYQNNEEAKKFYYLAINSTVHCNDIITIYQISQIIGPHKTLYGIDDIYEDVDPYKDSDVMPFVLQDEFQVDEFREYDAEGSIACYAITKKENGQEKIISISEPQFFHRPEIMPLHQLGLDDGFEFSYHINARREFLCLRGYNGSNILVFVTDNDVKLIDIGEGDEKLAYYIESQNTKNYYLITHTYSEDNDKFVEIDKESGEVIDRGELVFNVNRRPISSFILYGKSKTRILMCLQNKPFEINPPTNIGTIIDAKFDSSNDNDDKTFIIYYVDWDNEYKYVADLNNPQEVIFDVPSIAISVFGNFNYGTEADFTHSVVATTTKEKVIKYDYLSGKYYLFNRISRDKTEFIPTDKEGNDEREKIAKKNFADWQAQGGHSPEAKAQMDAMWDKDSNFSRLQNPDLAMNSWNDNDRGLDRDAPYWKVGVKDPNWNGALGVKDYNRELTDDDKCFYRIGKNGKPLDQPWNDEDEDVVGQHNRDYFQQARINESVKKMHNILDRINDLY